MLKPKNGEVKTLFVSGRPMAKERPRLGASGQFYSPDPAGYEERLAALWLAEHGRNPLPGPLSVKIWFLFGSEPGTHILIEPWDDLPPYVSRPDIDNCVKLVLDSLGPDNSRQARRQAAQLGVQLQGIAWNDDAQIVRLEAWKVRNS